MSRHIHCFLVFCVFLTEIYMCACLHSDRDREIKNNKNI
eukprot:gene12335-8463_t